MRWTDRCKLNVLASMNAETSFNKEKYLLIFSVFYFLNVNIDSKNSLKSQDKTNRNNPSFENKYIILKV